MPFQTLRNRSICSTQQVVETRIGSQPLQVRIDANEGKSNGMLAFSLRQPVKRIIALTEQAIDYRDLVRRYPLLLSSGKYLFQNGTGFFMPASSGEHVSAFRVRRRSITRKNPFLFVSSKCL